MENGRQSDVYLLSVCEAVTSHILMDAYLDYILRENWVVVMFRLFSI